MGVAQKAENTRLQRSVALKFLCDEFAREPDALNRFRRETRAASAPEHLYRRVTLRSRTRLVIAQDRVGSLFTPRGLRFPVHLS
jgi:hypothetical protein